MPKLIIESKTHGTHTVLFDEEDRELVEGHKWHLFKQKGRYTLYAVAHIPHPNGGWREWHNPKLNKIKRQRRTTKIYLHRIILNAPKNKQIDHRDGNGLNNTRENLRIVSHSENQRNKKSYKNNSSGYKGVDKPGSRWRARVHHEGNEIHIGYHDTAEDAARAYDAKIKELSWEIVNPRMLNFPDEKL